MKNHLVPCRLSGRVNLLASTVALLLLAIADTLAVSASDEIPAATVTSSVPAAVSNPAAAALSAQPEVWLCAGDRIMELLHPDAEWSFVKQHLDGIKLYVDQINEAHPDQLQQLVRLVKDNGYQVAVEMFWSSRTISTSRAGCCAKKTGRRGMMCRRPKATVA